MDEPKISYPTLNHLQDDNLLKSRVLEIKNILNQWEKDKKHYNKLKKKWNNFDSVVRYTGLALALGSTSAITIITAGAFLPVQTMLITVTALSSGAFLKLGFFDILSLKLAKNKRSKYASREQLINNYINKLWFLFEKSRNDNNITIEEIEKVRKLSDEYNNISFSVKSKNDGISYKEIKNINKKAKEELRMELSEKLIKEQKDKLRSDSFLGI